MAFYYGSNEPKKEDPKPGSWRETLSIIFAVFKALALPLGFLFGGIFAMLALVFAFTISAWLGLGILGAGLLVLVAYGFWEAKHPPAI